MSNHGDERSPKKRECVRAKATASPRVGWRSVCASVPLRLALYSIDGGSHTLYSPATMDMEGDQHVIEPSTCASSGSSAAGANALSPVIIMEPVIIVAPRRGQ